MKVLIYSLTGFILAILLTLLLHSKMVRRIIHILNNKTIYDDIFDNVIDYDIATTMCVYLKSSNIYYTGEFIYREEKGVDSWICLVNYFSANVETNEKILDPEANGLKSSVIINLHDIDRIELFYNDGSKIWDNMINRG